MMKLADMLIPTRRTRRRRFDAWRWALLAVLVLDLFLWGVVVWALVEVMP
jgi:hypothetical protein